MFLCGIIIPKDSYGLLTKDFNIVAASLISKEWEKKSFHYGDEKRYAYARKI
jgi:hypothetical protein